MLVDEIENGFHYSVLEDVWQAMAIGAEKNDTQIFATTHSFECIQAAHEAFTTRSAEQGNYYDLGVHRLERDVSGGIRAISYAEESLDTSLELDWEVR